MDYYNNYRFECYIWELSSDVKSIVDAAIWLIDNNSTIRKTAVNFGFAKSTLHKKFHSEIYKVSSELSYSLNKKLIENKKKYFK